MSLIIATHWTYTYGEGLSVSETRRFGTMKAARMWAAEVVPPVVTTRGCYWRDVGRGESVDFVKRTERGWRWDHCVTAGTFEAPVHIVPSVGELGWTP